MVIANIPHATLKSNLTRTQATVLPVHEFLGIHRESRENGNHKESCNFDYVRIPEHIWMITYQLKKIVREPDALHV